MAENVTKAEFLNYLLLAKHDVQNKEPPIIESHVDALNAPDVFKNFDPDFSPEHLGAWLSRLDEYLPVESPVLRDLIFGILYSSDGFVKLIRSKDFKYAKIAELYRAQFQENKKYLMEFNKRDRGRININAPSTVVTRFPPEPSGVLHIGHAKAAILNQHMARNGRLIVRFDDTNPEKESKVFEDAILEDLKLLKITDYKVSHSSDYFDVIFQYAVDLIRSGRAYADDTDRERMRQERTEGIASRNRGMSPEESLEIFMEMNRGGRSGWCLRAKISTDDLNKAMRDPVIYRSIDKAHHKTGDRYKIYPTYDFTVPIVDSLEGVTLSLRSNEYRDRNSVYYWFIDALGLENRPKIHDFSRLCFDNTVVSKRKMKWYVDNKHVEGWDDPRLCTLRGLKRLGMDMDALIEYIQLQGASQKSSVNSWDKIWAINKRVIDPKSTRYSAVPSRDHVPCLISDAIETESIECAKHKKNPDLGTKTVFFTNEILISQDDARVLDTGEEFTLMGWGNAIVSDKVVENGTVKGMGLKFRLCGDFKTTRHKINWVSRRGSVQVKLYEYGSLQNDVDSEDLEVKFNRDSKKEEWWLAEFAVKDAVAGDFVQFERIGFFYCDREMVFNLVPFTKQKRVY